MSDIHGRTKSFEDWVSHVFEYKRFGSPWFDRSLDTDLDPITALGYLTRLISDPVPWLAPYTNDEIYDGLMVIISGTDSDYPAYLIDVQIPWPYRREAIHTIETLYQTLFAPRCSPTLSHRDEPATSQLNMVCYMWWDYFPTWGGSPNPDQRQEEPEILQVIRRLLTIPSVAVQESALHGLGHWYRHYPEQVADSIDQFLKLTPDLRPELKQYALNARIGYVN